jgi:nitroimidazol reductase NimA-like FMN-containing flavoprotein (pyridoxamine 5'-phosphate oxidase superfamily)
MKLFGERAPVITELDTLECWMLLGENGVGRLAVRAEEGVDIYPLNFLVRDSVLYFRSAPGKKLVDLTAHPLVAFEADGGSGSSRWSVVLRGTATRLSDDAVIENSGVLELEPWFPSEKYNYIALVPQSITGRRFKRGR